jgi:ribosomal protein L17
MLRNMVSSLIEHQQITTTVAKAKEAQKLADQVINWGKKGRKHDWDRANSWLLVSLEPNRSSL